MATTTLPDSTPPQPHEVYLLRLNDSPVYVGITSRGHLKRFKDHRRRAAGLTVELLARTNDWRACVLMEYAAIQIYRTAATDGGWNIRCQKPRKCHFTKRLHRPRLKQPALLPHVTHHVRKIG